MFPLAISILGLRENDPNPHQPTGDRRGRITRLGGVQKAWDGQAAGGIASSVFELQIYSGP